MKRFIVGMVRQQLGPDYDVARHFTPRYNPWDQRLCLVPDADLFKALRSGRASVVTDTIESFTESGIRLASGNVIEADLIVTATGLQLEVLGGLAMSVDGNRIDFAKTITYKGMMYAGVPNMANVFGYTNASWTLKADLTCAYVCRLLNRMDKTGSRQITPRLNDPEVVPQPAVTFSSGYFQRSLERLPKQGSKWPWRLYQNYALDLFALKFGRLEDGALEFKRA
jgi:cation diffusion facilitator CzcD-associated flavoprotein CzcO